MANFCSKCGEPLSPDAKFCSACGAKVNSPVNLSKTAETTNALTDDERGNNPVHGGERVPDKGIYENFLRRHRLHRRLSLRHSNKSSRRKKLHSKCKKCLLHSSTRLYKILSIKGG